MRLERLAERWLCELASVLCWFFLLPMGRAHLHGIRLMMMAAVGLAGLYLLHKLSQDFQGIAKPLRPAGNRILKLSRLQKRELSPETTMSTNAFPGLNLANILSFDPVGCARKYVCHISSKSYKKLTSKQKKIIKFIRSSDMGNEWIEAADRGYEKDDCDKRYSVCFFSGRQLEIFMSLL